MIAALLFAQAVAGPVLPPSPRPRSDAPCPVTDTSDVVVCGRSNDSFRLKPVPPRAGRSALPTAEVRIGDARIAAEVEGGALAGGGQSQRLMVRLRLPLGPKRAR